MAVEFCKAARCDEGWKCDGHIVTATPGYSQDEKGVIGDFQGCLRVGNQRQVNGGQQKSSVG